MPTGSICARTALSVARDPEGLAAVVLSSPALPDSAPLPLRFIAQALVKVAPGAGVAPLGEPSGISRIKSEVDAYLADPLVNPRRVPALLGVTALAAAAEVRAAAPKWRAPTLMLHGTADQYTDPRASQRLFDALAAEDKRLELVAGARHELLNDMPRKRIAAELLAWIEAQLPAPVS